MVVLFVLLALFVFTAPFLTTARNADRASRHAADQAQARLALDAAGRIARARLESSHPSSDPTPYYDDERELSGLAYDASRAPASGARTEGFDPHDPKGVMWSAEIHDVAGRIDLDTAPPQVIANLLGIVARLSRPTPSDDEVLAVTSASPFAAKGVVWVGGELIRFDGRDEDGNLKVVQRGLETTQDKDDNWITYGPRPPSPHGVGSAVLDQRALAPVLWRTTATDGVPRDLDTVEQIEEADAFSLAGSLSDFAFDTLRLHATVDDGLRAGPPWQRSTRLVSGVTPRETYIVSVEDSRWFNTGATVRITNGATTELRFVNYRTQDGRLHLDRVLDHEYEPWKTEVSVLVRRPVNANTATAETLVAIFQNVGLDGANARVDESEARALAALVIESRPFTGLEDWMRRVVLPAAGIEKLPADAPVHPAAVATGGTILSDPRDAVALYLNALNANDARLGFSTMPLCFVSRDTYAMDLRAAVNAESGILRSTAVRERIELVTPQANELLHVFARQEDFDEALRLGRRAPWWATGPEVTTRYDGGVEPPSRAIPHFGTLNGAPYIPGISDPVFDDEGNARTGEHVFASRGDDGAWCQLAPARVLEDARTQGRMQHFDHELTDLEGRYLPEETLAFDPSDPKQPVQWAPVNGMMRPISFEAWVQPRASGDGTLVSAGTVGGDADRILLGMEGDDLVLRVLDGFGDHRLSALREAGEARFRIARSESDPGFPEATWSHVKVDVHGTRPDQIGMFVNGLAAGVRRPGSTRLTAPLPQGASVIQVESTEGFPDRGVVRIGDELIEYERTGSNTLGVQHHESGPLGGSGGRLARQRWNEVDRLPQDIATISVSHPRGAPVVLYGYSNALATDVPAGRSQLPSALGPWRLARVMGTPALNDMEPVQVNVLLEALQLGLGWLPENVGELVLALGDDPLADTEGSRVMSAFNPNGGYAALVGVRIGGINGASATTPGNYTIGGAEIVRYSGWNGNRIQIVERNAVASLPSWSDEEVEDPERAFVGPRAFVFVWDSGWIVGGQGGQAGTEISQLMNWQTYLLPISLPTPGATQLNFLQSTTGLSQFAQITELDEPERTEWVRYDDVDVDHGQLVRSSRTALASAYAAIFSGASFTVDTTPGTGGGGGGGGGPGGGGPGGGGGNRFPAGAAGASPPSGPSGLASRRAGSDWDPFLGADDYDGLPMSRAVASALHFRGVLGTATTEHAAGTRIVPVFQTVEGGLLSGSRADTGQPGAGDHVFLVAGGPNDLGWPATVHRGHLASTERPRHGWQQTQPGVFTATEAPPPNTANEQGDRIQVDGYATLGRIYVALDDAAPSPIVAGVQGGFNDPRVVPRVVKHPSGELPRFVTSVTVGRGAAGEVDLGVPAAVIDEIAFGHAIAFQGLPGANPAEHTSGSTLVLRDAITEASRGMIVEPFEVRGPSGRYGTGTGVPALSHLSIDGGLLRVGEEVIAYNGYDAASGGISFSANGRGLLGTIAQPHQPSEPVVYLEHWRVSNLVASVSADDSTLPIAGSAGFPPMGLVLIDDELVHYTRIVQGSLDMPRLSSEPGEMDDRGPGALRGRFGTTPAGHESGTAVILFPFRYWDRYAERFDGPELAYFGFSVDQPGAYWNGVTFAAEPGQWGGADVVVLERSVQSAPWDADPEETPGLRRLEDGTVDGDFVPIGAQADRVEWRALVRYRSGAFDPRFGLEHGWKETPRLRHLAVNYFGPGRILRSVDR